MSSEVSKYKVRFQKWISSPLWDDIASRLPDSIISIVTIVMNAKSDKEVSWLVLKNCDYALEKIESVSKTLKKGNRKR
jgi:hypothetical protein